MSRRQPISAPHKQARIGALPGGRVPAATESVPLLGSADNGMHQVSSRAIGAGFGPYSALSGRDNARLINTHRPAAQITVDSTASSTLSVDASQSLLRPSNSRTGENPSRQAITARRHPSNGAANAGSTMSSRTRYSNTSDAETFNSSDGTHKEPGSQSGHKYAPVFMWASAEKEDDDKLHDPKAPLDHRARFSWRGFLNIFTLAFLLLAIIMLFAGYPLIHCFLRTHVGKLGGFNLGGTNGTGQVPLIPGLFSLIDPDTPASARSWSSHTISQQYDLVFSDEFNTPGRTFWPGDDPFWEAVDIWYGATGDYEWYSPDAIRTTDDGALTIAMRQKITHNLWFESGMLQSWNKFCFSGGYIEFSSLLPGTQEQAGFWPALWTMGNLGRPGYLGSTDGMWPYTYDSCDWGTLKNQTNPEGTGPDASINAHGPYSAFHENKLSFLPGMRTGPCTCAGEDHPGPSVKVARASPEIDILEAAISNGQGHASQSLQLAPFDKDYKWIEGNAEFFGQTAANPYVGSIYQEAVSALAPIPQEGYVNAPNSRYIRYGMEYEVDWSKQGGGFISWYVDGKRTWTVRPDSFPARPDQNMGQRLIPVEPMSIIINLGMSAGFQAIDFGSLTFPALFKTDYVRVYQKSGEPPRTSCDPPDYPTAKYIKDHLDAYYNPNHTVFPQDMWPWPKNTLMDGCTQ